MRSASLTAFALLYSGSSFRLRAVKQAMGDPQGFSVVAKPMARATIAPTSFSLLDLRCAMNRFGLSTCVVVLLLGTGVAAQLDSAATIAKAEALLTNLQEGKFTDVYREFNPTMAKAIPEEKLRAVWDTLKAQFGALKTIDERRSGELQGFRAAELILTFDKERLVQRVVFDSDGKVAGLAFQRASMALLPPTK